MTDFEHFAIRNPEDGRIFYHLAGRIKNQGRRVTVHADGQPMTRLGDHGPWWAADHVAETITAAYEQYPETVGWKLRDTADTSEAFPAELTPLDFRLKEQRYGDEVMHRLYESVSQDKDPVVEEIPGPWRVLEGDAPDIKPDRPWVADIPRALTQHEQYHRYLPGHIPGLYSDVKKRAEKMPHVRYVFDPKDRFDVQGMKVTVEVPFETPQTEWRPAYGARRQELKRGGRNVQKLARRELCLPVPDRVRGENYAEALAAYEQQLKFWLGVLEDANVKACDACNGTGYGTAGSEKYEHTKR